MGESQWFQPTVKNGMFDEIVLANFIIKYGKFYDISKYLHQSRLSYFVDDYPSTGDPYNETMSVQGKTISAKSELEWGHCGRQSSPSGTEGSFEILLKDERIAEVYWDCPWGAGKNELITRFVKKGYTVSFQGFDDSNDSALGKGKIIILDY